VSTKIERELALHILAGKDEPGRELITKGMEVFCGVRATLKNEVHAALSFAGNGWRGYIQTELHTGARVRLFLDATSTPKGAQALLKTITKSGKESTYGPIAAGSKLPIGAINELVKRSCGKSDSIDNILRAIERARLQCYRLAEESTRGR
jgi:hypothetical protein